MFNYNTSEAVEDSQVWYLRLSWNYLYTCNISVNLHYNLYSHRENLHAMFEANLWERERLNRKAIKPVISMLDNISGAINVVTYFLRRVLRTTLVTVAEN